MTDEALLAGLGDGSSEVEVAFVRRFQAHVYGVALALVGEPAVAEDVAQQAFVRAWRHGSSFDPDLGTVRVWLSTITRNLAVDALRVRRPTPIDPADMVRLLGPGDDDPENVATRAETLATLRAAIRELPSEQARALVMAGVYRLTAQDVADREGIPLGTAKTRIRAAMKKLKLTLTTDHATYD